MPFQGHANEQEAGLRSHLLRKIGGPVRKTLSRLLRIGTSPESLALGIALGVACGLFPLFGTATVLCAIVGAMFRVNPVLIQTVNYAIYPIYFPVLALLVVGGQWLFGDEHDVVTMIHLTILQDNAGWWRTLGRLARLLAHAVLLWLLLAPPMVLLLRRLLLPWMRRILRYRRGSTASPLSPHMKGSGVDSRSKGLPQGAAE